MKSIAMSSQTSVEGSIGYSTQAGFEDKYLVCWQVKQHETK